MGVWIETNAVSIPLHGLKVTPYVGVWIETDILLEDRARQYVTPYVGVWIETFLSILSSMRCASHTLRGCVD